MVALKELIHREGDPGDFITVNAENCVACGKCIVVCPVNLWVMEKGKAKIRDLYKELCLECGSCWQVCDYNAVNFRYPRGGTGVVFKRG
ncbi:MAG: indolepyruvate ferredoxin oxidoreductase subunit alpha [Candidatus Helarchaeota archaeon]